MSSVIFTGLEELKAELRAMPAALTADASAIVIASAEAAKAEVIANYGRVTGNLQDHVVIETRDAGTYAASAVLKNTAAHAWIVENGSQARHYITRKNGVKKFVGRMPAAHVFIPVAIRRRLAMYEALKTMLETHRLEVHGRAA